jgi:hypothetical protein
VLPTIGGRSAAGEREIEADRDDGDGGTDHAADNERAAIPLAPRGWPRW